MGKFFPFCKMGFFSRGTFFQREKYPMGFFKNGFSCTNVMLLWCSGQYYKFIVAFARQLYTKYHIDGVLQTEMRQQTAWER